MIPSAGFTATVNQVSLLSLSLSFAFAFYLSIPSIQLKQNTVIRINWIDSRYWRKFPFFFISVIIVFYSHGAATIQQTYPKFSVPRGISLAMQYAQKLKTVDELYSCFFGRWASNQITAATISFHGEIAVRPEPPEGKGEGFKRSNWPSGGTNFAVFDSCNCLFRMYWVNTWTSWH